LSCSGRSPPWLTPRDPKTVEAAHEASPHQQAQGPRHTGSMPSRCSHPIGGWRARCAQQASSKLVAPSAGDVVTALAKIAELPQPDRAMADRQRWSMPVTISMIRPVGSRPSSGGHWEHRGCPYFSPRGVDDARSTS
jgi:hypothetical protein